MDRRIRNSNPSIAPRARDAWAVQHIGKEEKHTILENPPFGIAAITAATTPTTKDRRGSLMMQVHWPNGPEPMSRQPFKVGFHNIHSSIVNANIILEEGVRRDWDVIFLLEPWVEKKTGVWASTIQVGFDIVFTLMRNTKLVAYINVKYRYAVEKKEKEPNWCVLRIENQTSVGIYISKE